VADPRLPTRHANRAFPVQFSELEDEPTDEQFAALSRRGHAYHVSNDPRALWPSVSETEIQSAANAIGRAVAAILKDGRATLDDDCRSEAVGIAALILGVGPMLGHWNALGALTTDARVESVLATHLRHGRLRAARIARDMDVVFSALNASGITPAVMKGFHTGHAYFPELGVRPFADVDVVARPEEIGRVTDVLKGLGYIECAGLAQPYKREWRAPGQDERTRSFDFWHARSKWNIELHDNVTFVHTLGHEVRSDTLNVFDDTCPQLCGVRVASGARLIAMLAVHASGELYASRLLRLIELVLVVRQETKDGALDWKALRRMLIDANALRFAYPALQLAERLAPGTVDRELLAATHDASTARTRRIVATFTPTSPVLQSGTSLDERLMWMQGRWAVLHRVWVMIAPVKGASSRQVLAVYRSRLHRLVTGAVRWRAAPSAGRRA
jgi:hypothetical protein